MITNKVRSFRASLFALLIAGLMIPVAACQADEVAPPSQGGVTIRTEKYPRLPYSEATYYIYERDGRTICTKVAVCDKFDACATEYHAGTYKAKQDLHPYGITAAALIAPEKLGKHVCLSRYVKGLH